MEERVCKLLETVWGIVGEGPGRHILATLQYNRPGLEPDAITPDIIAEALILNNIPAWWVHEKLREQTNVRRERNDQPY